MATDPLATTVMLLFGSLHAWRYSGVVDVAEYACASGRGPVPSAVTDPTV